MNQKARPNQNPNEDVKQDDIRNNQQQSRTSQTSRHVGQRGVGIGSGGIADCGSLARNLACRLLSLKTNSANAIHQITSETNMMLNVVMWCERRLTKKAEPPPTRDVNRDSGTDSANGGWLRRLVRRLVYHHLISSVFLG